MKPAKVKASPTHPDAPLLAGFLSHLAHERRLSPLTCENYQRDVLTLLELAQASRLTELQIHQMRRFVALLHGRGLSGKTLARMLSAWRTLYRYLARDHGSLSCDEEQFDGCGEVSDFVGGHEGPSDVLLV